MLKGERFIEYMGEKLKGKLIKGNEQEAFTQQISIKLKNKCVDERNEIGHCINSFFKSSN